GLEPLGQELERDRLPERQIVSAKDFAHPAAAERSDDPVAIDEDGPRRKPAAIESAGGRRGGPRGRGARDVRVRRRDRRSTVRAERRGLGERGGTRGAKRHAARSLRGAAWLCNRIGARRVFVAWRRFGQKERAMIG